MKAFGDRRDQTITKLPGLGLWAWVPGPPTLAPGDVSIYFDNSFRNRPGGVPILGRNPASIDDLELLKEPLRQAQFVGIPDPRENLDLDGREYRVCIVLLDQVPGEVVGVVKGGIGSKFPKLTE